MEDSRGAIGTRGVDVAFTNSNYTYVRVCWKRRIYLYAAVRSTINALKYASGRAMQTRISHRYVLDDKIRSERF